ncbi:MAG: hypothetical protein R6U04_04810 [Bacteroidales bacterium]
MHWINLIIPGVILLPSLFFFWYSPSGSSEEWEKEQRPLTTILEWIGRIGIILTPIFTSLQKESIGEDMAVIVMIIFLLIYYACWFRFFAYEMDSYFLYAPLAGIPLPMAISPVIYFLFASYPLHSIPLLISTIIFGIGHIWNTYNSYKQIMNNRPSYQEDEQQEQEE